EFDKRCRARRSEGATLELAVHGTQHLSVAAAQNSDARFRRADELGERQSEANGDFPEDAKRWVRFARLDLGERRPADARGAREIGEGRAAGLAALTRFPAPPAPTPRPPHAAPAGGNGTPCRPRSRRIALASCHACLHYKRHATEITNTGPPYGGSHP